MPGPRALPALLLALAALVVIHCRDRAEPAPAPLCGDCNLLLISIDTLRADHLGCYGYSRDTSPEIDALAARSIVFERAYSASYQTAEAHMSLMTGLYPSVHRVRNANDLATPVVRLSPSIPTLAEVLTAAGFTTAGFHGGGNVSPAYGFDRGFERYDESEVGDAIAWIEDRRDRFFLFFHTYETHDPYTPSPPLDRRYDPGYAGPIVADLGRLEALAPAPGFDNLRDTFWSRVDPASEDDRRHLIALYDGEIRQVDAKVGRLIDAVLAAAPRTLVVLTSDHGEEFMEHGHFLHEQIYDQLLRVPLVVHVPDSPIGPRRIPTRVSTVALAPTLLELLGVAPPADERFGYQEEPLTPLLRGDDGAPAAIFAEKVFPAGGSAGVAPTDPRHMAVIESDRKLLWTGEVELYDLAEDPGETRNLAAEEHASLRPLYARMQEIQRVNNALVQRYYPSDLDPRQQLDPATVEQLGALGYID